MTTCVVAVPLTPEEVIYGMICAGYLSVDDMGRVWRLKKTVGGVSPRVVDIEPMRADRALPSGRRQVQVYVGGQRLVCSVPRLVWSLANGPLPTWMHIHHKNKVVDDNRLENLELMDASEHIAGHNRGRPGWNKGTRYGKTEAYKRSHAARMKSHAAKVEETFRLWESGLSAVEVARELGVCTRTVHQRLQSRRAAGHV